MVKLLNERQKKIIVMLRNNKSWMTSRELSVFFDVSDRTIRSDIKYINQFYNDTLIESDIKKGYHFNEKPDRKLNIDSDNTIPQTSYQRCLFIVQEQLLKNDEINVIYVMERVFVSDFSIENDVKQIKKMMEPYSTLKLVRRNNYIYFRGEEQQKRKFFTELFVRETKQNFFNLDRLVHMFNGFDLHIAINILEDTLKEYNYHLRAVELPFLIIYIGIAIQRMIKYKYIEMDEKGNDITNSIKFTISHEFFLKVSRKIPIKLVDSEITYLAFLILGDEIDDDTSDIVLLINSNYTLNQLINGLLQEIYTQFDIDLRNDEDLKRALFIHLRFLLERKKKNINMSNMYLGEIKCKYPLLFEMAVQVREFIEYKLNVAINENDISFIAQHLGGAFEKTDFLNKYKVLIINLNNQALEKLCVNKIECLFYERIKIVKCMNYFEKKKVMDIKPDLILTTLPLVHDLDILTVQISIFINIQDKNNIFQALNKLDNHTYKEEFALRIKTMMEERFFYIDVDLDTPEEIVGFISDKLNHAGLVEPNFKDSVLQREELSPTSFIYSFAIPHPLEARSRIFKIPVAILKKPVQWGEYQVKLVLLLAICENDQQILSTFLNWLSNLINDPKKLSSLMNVKSYEQFIKHIIE